MPTAVNDLAAQLLPHLVDAYVHSPNVASKRGERLTRLCVHYAEVIVASSNAIRRTHRPQPVDYVQWMTSSPNQS